MPSLFTTLGSYSADQLGMVLPHEHIFVDLSPLEEQQWQHTAASAVIDKMAPELARAKRAGVTALVECTPVGVGRRADILKRVSEAANFPLVVPTGIYREPWIPPWAHEAPLDKIRDWMISELTDGIESTSVQAGWIKLSAGDEGITQTERKILRAAAQAGLETNAVIGSHTIRGKVVLDQLRIVEEEGYFVDRFIWIHTQAEDDFKLHLEIAGRGAWLEYDSIGGDWVPEERLIELVTRVLDAGHGDQLLLSHDRGWFDPSKPGGGETKSFDYLSLTFLPKLRRQGVKQEVISKLVERNPFRAFGR